MLVCMVPGATVFSMLATPSLQLLFQRGSFHLTDAVAIGGLLPVMLCGMVAMSCMGLVFKALFARREARIACALSLVGSIVYFTLSGLLSTWLGLTGIGIAYAVSWWLVLVLGVGYLWRDVPFLALVRSKFRFIFQVGVAVILVTLICWLGIQLLPSATSPNDLVRFLVVLGTWILAFVTYLGFGTIFPGFSDVHVITQKLISFIGHKQPVTR